MGSEGRGAGHYIDRTSTILRVRGSDTSLLILVDGKQMSTELLKASLICLYSNNLSFISFVTHSLQIVKYSHYCSFKVRSVPLFSILANPLSPSLVSLLLFSSPSQSVHKFEYLEMIKFKMNIE